MSNRSSLSGTVTRNQVYSGGNKLLPVFDGERTTAEELRAVSVRLGTREPIY